MFSDFNINFLNKTDIYTKEFSLLLQTFNLEQTVTKPTYISGSLIDFIIIDTYLLDSVIKVETPQDFRSDHYPVKLLYKTTSKTLPRFVTKKVWNYQNSNIDLTAQHIDNSVLNNPAVFSNLSSGKCIELYNKILSQIFDLRCPIITKRYRIDCVRPLWYNSVLQHAKQIKRKAERKFKKHPTEENKAELNKLRNQYNRSLRQHRTEYFWKKISTSMKDPKSLFRTLNTVSGRIKKNTLPTFDSDINVAEELSKYYTNKIADIRRTITNNNLTNQYLEPEPISGPDEPNIFNQFQTITLTDLNKIIKSMKKNFQNWIQYPRQF